MLRTDGVPAFSETLNVAARWLDAYWSQTSIRCVDEDAILRRNALNCFADPMAVVDGLRRLPLVTQPAARHVQPSRHRHRDRASWRRAKATPRSDENQINAAFAAMPLEPI